MGTSRPGSSRRQRRVDRVLGGAVDVEDARRRGPPPRAPSTSAGGTASPPRLTVRTHAGNRPHAHQLGHHRGDAADHAVTSPAAGRPGQRQQVLGERRSGRPRRAGRRSRTPRRRSRSRWPRARRRAPPAAKTLARPAHQRRPRLRCSTPTALGTPGRARGVDQVGEVAGAGRRRGVLRGSRRQSSPSGRDRASGRRSPPPGRRGGRRLADHHAGPGVRQHQRQPLARVGRVERHVGASRLQHGEQAHHHPLGAPQADPHPVLRPHARAGAGGGRAGSPGAFISP